MTGAVATLWHTDEAITVERGDLWALGDHRLICGDSTDAHEVSRLMQGAQADAAITDPPYGVINAEWDVATLDFIAPMGAALHEYATAALFCTLPFGFALHMAMQNAGWMWRWETVWTKVNGGFKVSQWMPRPAHEHIFAYARKGAAASCLTFNGYDAGEPGDPWTSTATGKGDTFGVYKRRSLSVSAGRADGRRWMRSVLQGREKTVMRLAERTEHPTQKPREVVTKLALLLTHADGLIYDPFLGSGTTLLVAEETGRRVFGIELSEAYCELIIRRWQAMTGRRASKCEK